MMCDRCLDPIRPGETCRTVHPFRQSGAGLTLRYHLACYLQALRGRR